MQCYDERRRRMLLLYDDECYYCTRFALFVHKLYAYLGYKVVLVGLYTTDGYNVKRSLLYERSSNPDGMFWLIQINPDHIKAYGGRRALLKLAIELIRGIVCKRYTMDEDSRVDASLSKYYMGCSSNEEPQCMESADGRRCGLLSRIASLLTNGKKIVITTEEHKN
ncbi:MAG: hypothetical protein QXW14_01055 [Candidatus Nitrosocaldus sp.]